MKKLLFCSEASDLNTGYAVYAKEMISRIFATGRYDILEYANYGSDRDPNRNRPPWKFVGVLPNNEEEERMYKQSPLNEFGSYKFDNTCLHFKPDVVFNFTDYWMQTHILTSPLRRYFKYITMPTIDCDPQQEEWIDGYKKADHVLTYSKWAENLIGKQAPNFINLVGQASPAADYNIFQPVGHRGKYKQQIGLDPNMFIIGTVMRNQKRKLYPRLIEMFEQLNLPNSYLYLHTKHPDLGWDLPYFIKNSKLSHRILVTYACNLCKTAYPSHFQGSCSVCKRCGNFSAEMPGSMNGIPTESLAGIINLFDVYLQYSCSEGFGMPMLEAAACGVPVLATDYSAMSSVVREIGGYPLKVGEYYWEPEKNCKNALPDNDDTIAKIRKIYNTNYEDRMRQGLKIRKLAMENFSYDRSAQKLMELVDECEGNWDAPPDIINPTPNVPNNLTPDEFVQWCLANVLGRPELINTYTHLRILRDLNYGQTEVPIGALVFDDMSMYSAKKELREYKPKNVLEELSQMREKINFWEKKRCNLA